MRVQRCPFSDCPDLMPPGGRAIVERHRTQVPSAAAYGFPVFVTNGSKMIERLKYDKDATTPSTPDCANQAMITLTAGKKGSSQNSLFPRRQRRSATVLRTAALSCLRYPAENAMVVGRWHRMKLRVVRGGSSSVPKTTAPSGGPPKRDPEPGGAVVHRWHQVIRRERVPGTNGREIGPVRNNNRCEHPRRVRARASQTVADCEPGRPTSAKSK